MEIQIKIYSDAKYLRWYWKGWNFFGIKFCLVEFDAIICGKEDFSHLIQQTGELATGMQCSNHSRDCKPYTLLHFLQCLCLEVWEKVFEEVFDKLCIASSCYVHCFILKGDNLGHFPGFFILSAH